MTDNEIDQQLDSRGWQFNVATGLFHLVSRTDDDSIVDWDDVLAALPSLTIYDLDDYRERKIAASD